MISTLKSVVIFLGIVLLIVIAVIFVKKNERRYSEVLRELSESKQMVEVHRGIYLSQSSQVRALGGLLSEISKKNSTVIKDLGSQPVIHSRITAKVIPDLKGPADSIRESISGPSEKNHRLRVDFQKEFNGTFLVEGYTLTDPAEAIIGLRQIRPISIDTTFIKNDDGKISAVISSPEADLTVEKSQILFDFSPLKQKWYQRFWLEAGAALYGDPSISLGLSYHLDKGSLGVFCNFGDSQSGCGVSFGRRISF